MEILLFLALYILTGTIRVVRDFFKRDITSAQYVMRPHLLVILSFVLFWPFFPLARLLEQRRRMDIKYIFRFYLVPFILGCLLYATSLRGFFGILASESELYIKVLEIIGILIVFSVVIWWLAGRLPRYISELHQKWIEENCDLDQS